MPFRITGRDYRGPLDDERVSPVSAVVLGMKWEREGARDVRIKDNAGQLHGVPAFQAIILKQKPRDKPF